MTNVESKVENGKLVLTIDLTQTHGRSSTGKTLTVATTHGFVQLSDENFKGIGFSVNVNKKE